LPLISVVIPTFNRPQLLSTAVNSARAQSIGPVEIVIPYRIDRPQDVEQLSADGTSACLIFCPFDPKGAASGTHAQIARNVGTASATGDFCLFLDDDDILAPNCLKGRVKLFGDKPQSDFVVGQCRMFEVSPRPEDPLWNSWSEDQDDLECFLKSSVPWQTTGPLWRRRALQVVGPWDESLEAGHDYEFHIRALAKGLRGSKLNEVDYYWRKPREDSYSSFDAMKRQHSSGAHIKAFALALASVSAMHAWNRHRRAAAWREAIRLAVLCRLHGGGKEQAIHALQAARMAQAVGLAAYLEVSTCIQAWTRVGGTIPAMAYMKRRGWLARSE
jgi:hypothetical protein